MRVSEQANTEPGRGRSAPRSTGSFAGANFPPVDTVREGPSKADKDRANEIHLIATEIEKELLKKQKGRDLRLVAATSGLTVVGVLGGQFLMNKVFADEPTPENRSIDSFPNNFNPENKTDGVFDRVAGRKAAIAENERDGKYEMTPPPNRQPEKLSNIPTTTSLQDIPHIPEVDSRVIHKVNWGLFGFLEEYQVLVDNVDKKGMHTQTIPPSATITGYLIAKERQQDGSVMFAIELPYLDSPKDILTRNSESSTPELKKSEPRPANLPPSSKVHIGGTIVWIKTFEGNNPPDIPFHSTISWGGPDVLPTNKTGSGGKPLAEFSRVGDIVFARIPLDPNLQLDPAHLDKSLQEYVELHGGSIEAAKQRLTTITQDNLHNAQHLLTDANTNTQIPLETQLDSKSYVFTADSISFSQ